MESGMRDSIEWMLHFYVCTCMICYTSVTIVNTCSSSWLDSTDPCTAVMSIRCRPEASLLKLLGGKARFSHPAQEMFPPGETFRWNLHSRFEIPN